MVPKIISQSRITEVNTVSENLLIAYKKESWDSDAYIQLIFGELQTESGYLTTAINRSKAKSNLDSKDLTRDEKVKALYHILIGLSHHPDAAIKLSANNLLAIFSKYGLKITQTSYASESALMDSLLEDMAAPEVQNDIANLSGCAEIITELQTTQDEFKSAHFSWEEKKAQEGLSLCATDIKKKVISCVNEKIIPYLKAMQLANGAVYGELTQTVAQIINDNNDTVKKRRKKEDIELELSVNE